MWSIDCSPNQDELDCAATSWGSRAGQIGATHAVGMCRECIGCVRVCTLCIFVPPSQRESEPPNPLKPRGSKATSGERLAGRGLCMESYTGG